MKNNILEPRNCPNCGAIESILKYKSKIKINRNTNYKIIQKYWDGFFNEKAHFNYNQCGCCNLIYNNLYPTQDTLDKLYQSMKPNMNEAGHPNIIKTHKNYAKLLDGLEFPEGNYIEIGPGEGYFAKEAFKKNIFEKFFLFEPNIVAHNSLREIKNSKIYTSLDSINKIDDNSISLLVLIQVLDHLLEPKKLLLKLNKKIKNNAIVIMISHNESSIPSKLMKRKWPIYCIQHPQLFDMKTVENFFNRHNFKKILTKPSKNTFSLGFLLSTFLHTLGIKISINIPIINLNLKFGNMIYIGKRLPAKQFK